MWWTKGLNVGNMSCCLHLDDSVTRPLARPSVNEVGVPAVRGNLQKNLVVYQKRRLHLAVARRSTLLEAAGKNKARQLSPLSLVCLCVCLTHREQQRTVKSLGIISQL